MSLDQRSARARRSNGAPVAALSVTGTRVRDRRPGLAAASALVVLLGAVGGGVLASRAGQQSEVVVTAGTVARGQTINRADLTSDGVSGVDGAVLVGDVDQVLGKTATVDMVPGQVITGPMETGDSVPGAGQTLVGLSVDSSHMPAGGIAPGDSVRLVGLPDAAEAGEAVTDPTVLAARGLVQDVRGEDAAGGTQVVAVVVPEDEANRIAVFAAADRVAVVKIASDGGG